MPKFILESVGWGLVASSLHYSIPIAALRLKNLYSPPILPKYRSPRRRIAWWHFQVLSFVKPSTP